MTIQVENVGKRFGNYEAVRNVSLTIENGELVALLGPSGSGKTSLLRMIAGLETPDSGRVLVGESEAHILSQQRRVGFVFQHYALFPHMTVFENVAFGLRVKPKKQRPSDEQIRDKVMDLLRLVQLNGMAHRRPNQLSGGQRQRVALARVLAVEPSVLLLDEPFGALDAKVRKQLRAWMRRLHEELKITTVLVTHDQEEALEVADRIVIMNAGGIEQNGSPEEVFHHPASEFVMTFLGEVNRFRGEVSADGVKVPELASHLPGQVTGQLPQIGATGQNHADVFVRPFDLQLEPADSTVEGVAATIHRVKPMGARVQVQLVGADKKEILVELTSQEWRELKMQQGGAVRVIVRRAKVFSITEGAA